LAPDVRACIAAADPPDVLSVALWIVVATVDPLCLY
jgi:hypothetical protein